MATFTGTFSSPAPAVLPSPRSIFAAMRATAASFFARQLLIRELESHTDRQLADMGITRSDIPAVASGRFVR